jgi:transcriptional regulator with XRE-family HTH domain
MSGTELRSTRQRLGLTQVTAAGRWRVSQAYLSLMEQGKRAVPERVARLAVRTDASLATGLALDPARLATSDLERQLGSLGYPGFAYLGQPRLVENPAAVVFSALSGHGVSARVTEGVPWVLLTYPHLHWDWLVDQVRLANRQNRLGFLVTLARQLAERRGETTAMAALERAEARLEEARLAAEDTLGRSLTAVERDHLREARTAQARHWNVLTSLQVDQLRHAG